MNLVFIVMQCYFFPFLPYSNFGISDPGKESIKFSENLVHLQISLKKEILYWSYVVSRYIFKEVSLFFVLVLSVQFLYYVCLMIFFFY